MTKTVSQKSKNKPLSEQVRKAMKKYFAELGDTSPANVYEMVMAEAVSYTHLTLPTKRIV